MNQALIWHKSSKAHDDPVIFRKALRLVHWEYCFLSLWLDPSHPLRGLFRKWALLDIVCLFGVTVRRKAFLPSGIHDNAVIQSASHLLPFTLPEETIMGRDGPLSTDEARSHFLDGFACVYVCLCVSVLVYVCCVTRKAFVFHNTRAAWDCCTFLTVALWRGLPCNKLSLYLVHAHTFIVRVLVSNI